MLENIPFENANKMVTESTIELCRSNAQSTLLKSAFMGKFNTPKEVVAKFLIESRKEVEEKRVLSVQQTNSNRNFGNNFQRRNNFNRSQNQNRGNFNRNNFCGNFQNNFQNNFRGNFNSHRMCRSIRRNIKRFNFKFPKYSTIFRLFITSEFLGLCWIEYKFHGKRIFSCWFTIRHYIN